MTVIPTTISFAFILQFVHDVSSRSFEKLQWKLTRNGEDMHTLKIKNKQFLIIVRRVGNYFNLRYVLKPEDKKIAGKLRITGQEFSQLIDTVNSRVFR